MNNGNGWVSVTERTPKKDGTYLVTLSGELVGQNKPFTSIELFEGGEWEEDGDRMDEYARTIHKETERNAQKARQREQLKDGSRSVGEYKPVRNGMREKGRKGDNMEYKDLYLTDRRGASMSTSNLVLNSGASFYDITNAIEDNDEKDIADALNRLDMNAGKWETDRITKKYIRLKEKDSCENEGYLIIEKA